MGRIIDDMDMLFYYFIHCQYYCFYSFIHYEILRYEIIGKLREKSTLRINIT